MKRVLAVALLAATSVHAQELKFGDLNYFLQGGQFNLLADVNLQTATFRPKGGDEIHQEAYVLNSRLGYGINERLNAFIGLNYQFNTQVEVAGDKRFEVDGLQNPYLGATYRLLSQKDQAFNLDLGAIATVKLQDAEAGDEGLEKDGNAVNPRNSLDVFASLGKKWNEANEYRFTAGVLHNFEGEYDNQGATTTTTDVDASTDFYLRAAYQYRPVHEFMMTVALQGTQVASVEETDANNSVTEYDSHLDFDFSFTAKYLITENFIARFNYSQGRNSDFDQTEAGVSTEIRKRREKFFGLGVDFLF